MKEITLITAFFDIGRDKFLAIPRNNDKYFEHFKFWSRIKNDLIVYTTENESKRIYEIRKSFGLEDKTKIIIISDLEEIEPEIYNNMCRISENQTFKDFRFLENATSNIAKYSYLMLLKTWFINDAVSKGLTSEFVAWIDFGFNHGNDLYTESSDFNFKWEYDFENKIYLFYYKILDERPIFEIVRRLSDSIMGCLFILPKSLSKTLWEENKKSMQSLIEVDLIDDDQLILLMTYRRNKDIFKISKSDWFLPLKELGADHLTIKQKKQRSLLKEFVVSCILKSKYIKKVIKYVWKTLNNLIFK